MFKMLDRLVNHWSKMVLENEWYLLVVMGEMFILVLGSWYIFYMIVLYVVQIPCFLEMERFEAAANSWFVFLGLCLIIVFAKACHTLLEKKKKEQRYESYVKQKTPVHKLLPDMAKAFFPICVTGLPS